MATLKWVYTADTTQAALATQRRQLKAAQARLQVLQDQTEALIASQKATYSKLKYDAAKAAAVLAAQKKSDAALGSLIDRLIAQKKVVYGIPSGYSGSLRWPMPGTITACTLAGGTASTATCTVTFQSTGAGTGSVSAHYAGDSTHTAQWV